MLINAHHMSALGLDERYENNRTYLKLSASMTSHDDLLEMRVCLLKDGDPVEFSVGQSVGSQNWTA